MEVNLKKASVKDFLEATYANKDFSEFATQYPNMRAVWDALANGKGDPDCFVWLATRPELVPDKELRSIAFRIVRTTPIEGGRTVWILLTDERNRRAVKIAEINASCTEIGHTTGCAGMMASDAAWFAVMAAVWDYNEVAARTMSAAATGTVWATAWANAADAAKEVARKAARNAALSAAGYATDADNYEDWAAARDAEIVTSVTSPGADVPTSGEASAVLDRDLRETNLDAEKTAIVAAKAAEAAGAAFRESNRISAIVNGENIRATAETTAKEHCRRLFAIITNPFEVQVEPRKVTIEDFLLSTVFDDDPEIVKFIRGFPSMRAVWSALAGGGGKPEWFVWLATSTALVPDKDLRLVACQIVRTTPIRDGKTTWKLITRDWIRQVVEVAERHAKGEASDAELNAVLPPSLGANVRAAAASAGHFARSAIMNANYWDSPVTTAGDAARAACFAAVEAAAWDTAAAIAEGAAKNVTQVTWEDLFKHDKSWASGYIWENGDVVDYVRRYFYIESDNEMTAKWADSWVKAWTAAKAAAEDGARNLVCTAAKAAAWEAAWNDRSVLTEARFAEAENEYQNKVDEDRALNGDSSGPTDQEIAGAAAQEEAREEEEYEKWEWWAASNEAARVTSYENAGASARTAALEHCRRLFASIPNPFED